MWHWGDRYVTQVSTEQHEDLSEGGEWGGGVHIGGSLELNGEF